MKFFKKALCVLGGVIAVYAVLWFILWFILWWLFDPPLGCDPELSGDPACDYINKRFERELKKLPQAPVLSVSEKRPVFFLGESYFAKGAEFDYLYIKDEFGVWLRYEYSNDFLLQKDMPERYYGYYEINRSPNEDWVGKKLRYYRYGIYDISLFENEAKIFSQTAHKVIRKFIGTFDLHSQPGTSFAAPQGTEENLNAIRRLQIPLADFPQKPNYFGLDWADEPEARGYSGDKIAKKLARNIFEIKGEGWRQTIRINRRAKDIKVICGDEICLALAFDENEFDSCDNNAPLTKIYTLNLKQKFSDFHTLTSKNFDYVKIGDKYALDDVKSFKIVLSRYRYIKGYNKGREITDYEVILQNSRGEQVNEICRNEIQKLDNRTQ